jgi:cytochrome b561
MPAGETSLNPRAADRREERYDAATVWLHWVTVGLVTVLWLIGQVADWFPRGPARSGLWSVHVLLGLTLALVLVARIAWRARFGRTLPPVDPAALHAIAAITHYALYLLLLAAVVTGLVNASYRGFSVFDVWAMPRFGSGDAATRRSINGWHEWASNLTVLVAFLHAAAALLHHYVLRDRILERMRPPG